jgi:hypothetical protein
MKKIAILFLLPVLCLQSFSQVLNKSGLKTYTGFFNFYYDETSDKIYLEVNKLDYDFLYVNSLASGVGSNDIGLDRGQLGQKRIVHFEKAGNKLLLVQPNLMYRANTTNTLERRSIEQAFAKSVLYGFKILSDDKGKYLIDFTPFLMQDTHGVAATLKRKKQGTYSLDLSKSALALERTKAFLENVEFEALLTFKGQPTGQDLKSVTPTSSLVSVIQHHSLIKLPDDDFRPRKFDPRSGAISMSYYDYASPIQESIKKQVIIRHRLQKKDPYAEKSEPVEPIVYYLDPGTPEPVRSALIEGASWWNEAFEAIGFENAFQVKMLPEGADPMDCRYNVIQWVHRSTRGWSYGASVVDPRSGEIIKGHVSLGSLRARQDFLIAQALMNRPYSTDDDAYQPMLNLALARIRQLSAHEVGHTLGFTHNFASSSNSRASVMDYPHPLLRFKDNQLDISKAYDTGIGEWDKVAVAYSYSDFDDRTSENDKLKQLLDKAYARGLRFISDSDARASGGAHPFAHLWDNGNWPHEELNAILNFRRQAISNFSEDNIKQNEPYSVLEDVFVPLYFLHRYQTEAATKVIGGLDYNYKTKGDNQFSVLPVDGDIQLQTLESVIKTLQASELAIPRDKLNLFPPRAYGFNRTRESFKSNTGVAFDPLSAASTASEMTLKFLLHPERANRLVLQKGLDSNQLGLDDVFDQIIKKSFLNEIGGTYLLEVQMQINYNVLQHIMNLAVHDKSYFQVKALANNALLELSKSLDKMDLPEIYVLQFKYLIEEFFEHPELFKVIPSPKIPDGSPIGSGVCNYNPILN